MAQPAKSKNANARSAPAVNAVKDGPNWLVFGLACVGMALSAYLTYSAWQEKLVAFCTAGSDCDVVLNSEWSRLFGIPTSLWGFLTYALIAAVAWNKRTQSQWQISWALAFFGLLFSLYLTFISFFQLRAACPYCLASLGLMAAIFVVVTMQKPERMRDSSWGPWLGKTAGVALVAIVALHLHFAGYWGKAPTIEDPWIRGLADHLTKIEAKFYGASWCPHCKDQKEMFGASAKRLPYVECSPAGPKGPVAEACKTAGVQSYPTWVIKGQRMTGTIALETLAQNSEYKFTETR
ncbi:MAG: vitamin K epoxide reductase family protein [Deltaproteobacteria bacterium]|nr:vitamin K epoxide reductase family protein [Deltaproteobacteria bacterium]MBM4298208.1 vitamin K epoxide reductase family protein [Deltaproteobacteria bacterium]